VSASDADAKRFEHGLAEAAWSLERLGDFRADHDAIDLSL
jgi:hypothetical protein